MYKFSIIIPTCNRNDLLCKCLDLLESQVTGYNRNTEVIISDDSKENGAKKVIEKNYNWAKWVEGPKKGPAANRNNGAKYASGDWLIFIDDDCQPEKKLIEGYNNALIQNPDVKVFEGRVFADRQKARMDEEAPLNEVGGVLWSCNFMINKTFFEEINGFNENFPYPAMEDVEFRERIKDLTHIKFVNDASVMHPWRITLNPKIKFINAFESHKMYFNVRPQAKYEFRKKIIMKQFFSLLIKSTLKDLFIYKGRGWKYSLHHHIFQLKLIFLT